LSTCRKAKLKVVGLQRTCYRNEAQVKGSEELADAFLPSVTAAVAALSRSATSSRELVSTALTRARDPDGEGARAFTQLHAATARRDAEAWDARHAAGAPATVLGGLPVSVKDLFDVAGYVTTAGSRVLADTPAATVDADAVIGLRRAGAIIVGKTNMTEFAYSGVGLNPHYGTPRNPFDRAGSRIPGGSSSGAAVSVADGMCVAAIGTDTGGSVRIPAALCGLVGFKPTADRISQRGVYPLSKTLDSIGSIARTVECCAVLDAVMAGLGTDVPAAVTICGTAPLHRADAGVGRRGNSRRDEHRGSTRPACPARACSFATSRWPSSRDPEGQCERRNYGRRGVRLASRAARPRAIGLRSACRGPHRTGPVHQRRPTIADLLDARARIGRSVLDSLGEDAIWIMPTVPHAAPEIAALEKDEAYFAINRLMLRNAALVNFLDGCAITLPCHAAGSAPVGLSLVAAKNQDRRLLAVARALAPLIACPVTRYGLRSRLGM
jgi:aspartyl-tRNA(Asn)/glutamyl-tRNA(Gln) amidotransferase subunit A